MKGTTSITCLNNYCYIKNILDEKGIDEKQYDIMILNKEQILKSYESLLEDSNSTTHLSEIESQFLSTLGESPATPQSIASKRPVSPDLMLDALRSLEKKKLIKPEYCETKTTKTDLKHNAITKKSHKKKYYELTAQGKEIIQDEKPKESPTEDNYVDYLPEQSDDVLVEHLKDPDFENKDAVILILENRGYRVSVKNNKVKLYRRRS